MPARLRVALRMRYRSLTVLAACVLVTACASRRGIDAVKPALTKGAEQRREMLFGWWVSRESIRSGGTRIEVALRCPNGVYFFDFRTRNAAGQLTDDAQEVGDWGISGPVYFTITRGGYEYGKRYEADAKRAYYYDAYRILELSYTRFRYRSYATGNVYGAQRALPDDLARLREEKGVLRLPSGCQSAGRQKSGA